MYSFKKFFFIFLFLNLMVLGLWSSIPSAKAMMGEGASFIDEGHFPRTVAPQQKYIPALDSNKPHPTLPPVLVASFDGGGARGYASSLIIKKLKDQLEETLGQPFSFSKTFDLTAGSSTGGLIALMTAFDFPPEKCVNLYQTQAPRIFSRSWPYTIESVGGLRLPKYDVTQGLEPVLKEELGDRLLRDADVPVFVTTFATQIERLLLLDSEHAKKSTKGYHMISVQEAARATSAAPTYFAPAVLKAGYDAPTTFSIPPPPLKVNKEKYPELTVIDGGVAVNTPAQLACDRALELYPGREIILLSIGTGQPSLSISRKGEGLIEFAPEAIDAFAIGASEAIDTGLKMQLGKNYYRFEFQDDSALDDTSPETFQNLAQKAEEIAQLPLFKDFVSRAAPILKEKLGF
jgi:predicted acylesterase/phospholipase RssA